MRNIFLNRAIAEAVIKEMELDPNVVLIGEDVVNRGGGMSAFLGVYNKFPDRCLDMPIAESGYGHFSNGAALCGLRPVVDFMFSDFLALPFDPIVNGAAKFHYCSLGKSPVPIVYVAANGGRGTYDGVGSGCNHSQTSEAWFMNVPGLKIVAPYYPEDACGLMRAAIRDNDPVLFLYHEGSLGRKQEVPDVIEPIPLNRAAKVLHEGDAATVVAIQSMVPLAVQAAQQLADEGVQIDLIDPRVLIPLDIEKIAGSLKKTGKLVIVTEEHTRGSFAGEILRQLTEMDITMFRKSPKVIGALNTPIASGYGEAYIMPHTEDIVKAVKDLL